ncbi:MAG: hypothetical protein V1797_08165 [Pseudomonadota bacterium]
MSPASLLHPEITSRAPFANATLADPHPSLLARFLESRVASEEKPGLPRLPGDCRPLLPPVGLAAVMLYAQRRAVDSYPLIYTTLALAHPN